MSSKREKRELRYRVDEKCLSVDEIEKIDVERLNRISRTIKNKNRRNALQGKIYLKKAVLRKQKKEDAKVKKRFNLPVVKKRPRMTDDLAIFDDSKICEENEKFINNEKCVDEFSEYFKKQLEPNIVITSVRRPSNRTILFIKELSIIFPGIFYEPRYTHNIDYMIENAVKNKFTTFMLIEQDRHNRPKFLYISTLPNGPTSKYMLSSISYAHKKKKPVEISDAHPELFVTNFNTVIGERIKRQLSTLVPYDPDYRGRKIVVFFNKRDFIFFRHFKYEFENKQKCHLEDIGPGFTLKLLNLKSGLINDKEKMYEFVLRPDMKVDRKRMYL